MTHLIKILSIVLFIVILFGCSNDNGEIGDYRYRTDMYDQQNFREHEDPRPPVKGTVPTSGYEIPIKDSISASGLINPVENTLLNTDTSKFLFETYCSPCHGIRAKGDGPVAAKFQKPPDLTSEKYIKAPDGYLYYVIRHGKLIMPPYYESVKSHERWLIINYLRKIQRENPK